MLVCALTQTRRLRSTLSPPRSWTYALVIAARTASPSFGRRIAEVGYVAIVAALTLIGTSDLEHGRPQFLWAALVLALPMMVPFLPVLYLGTSTLRNVLGDHGVAAVAVPASYVLIVAGAAVCNVRMLRSYGRGRRTSDSLLVTPR